jgi:P-type conjugative transfer protein TrbJ
MKKQILALCLIGGLVLYPGASTALFGVGDIVFDPTQYAQQLIESVWWLEDLAYQAEQIANQVIQIEQMILMVESWALALKNLDFSVLPIVGGVIDSFIRVFDAAQNVFFNAALIQEKFKELYSPFHGELLESSAYFTKGFDWNNAVREAHSIAMQQQAHLPESLKSAADGLQQALLHSEAAVGGLQAQQAGNELLGVQIAQQNEMNALLGTMAHTQSTRDMLEAAARDQAMLRLEAAMDKFTEVTPTEGLRALPSSFR